MIEEGTYRVTARLVINIAFAPLQRATRLSKYDAIANAVGTVPDGTWDALEGEGWSVEFDAERIG